MNASYSVYLAHGRRRAVKSKPCGQPGAIYFVTVNSETNPEQSQNNCLVMHHPGENGQGFGQHSNPLQRTTPTPMRICEIRISWVRKIRWTAETHPIFDGVLVHQQAHIIRGCHRGQSVINARTTQRVMPIVYRLLVPGHRRWVHVSRALHVNRPVQLLRHKRMDWC